MQTTLDISSEELRKFIELGLREDVGTGDVTSEACIREGATCEAELLVKEPGILAGVAVAERMLLHVDPSATIEVFIQDGKPVSFGDVAMEVKANTRALLRIERLLLNTMQRMSGVATLSNRFAFEVEDLPVKILDTRKTTPGQRFLEKWAVRLGGCHNYRDGLFDWFMIKDNHIDACGSITKAIERVKAYQAEKGLQDMGVTVEVRNLVEVQEVLDTGKVTRILLDNFELPILAEAVAHIAGRFETEASGGINIHNVRHYAKTGVDFISVGALTHSVHSLDLSLKVR